MPPPKQFVIDANTFMQAARTYYSFTIAKPFWKALTEYTRQGKIISIDKVSKEINKGNDELKKWANKEFSNFFAKTQTNDIYIAYNQIINWADVQPTYNQLAKDELLRETNADPWLVAYAKCNDCIVTTFEKSSPTSTNTIMIPDICDAFNIKCMDTFEMLNQLGFYFSK